MPYTDQHWKRFFIEAGEPALADDPRFANISLRTQNIEALYEIAERLIANAHDGSMAGGVRAARDPRIEDEPARGTAGRRAPEGDRLLRNHRGPVHGTADLPRRAGSNRRPPAAGAHGTAPGRAHGGGSRLDRSKAHERQRHPPARARVLSGRTSPSASASARIAAPSPRPTSSGSSASPACSRRSSSTRRRCPAASPAGPCRPS